MFFRCCILAAILVAPGFQAFKLTKVDATGTSRLSVSDVAKLSGLVVGQSVTQDDLDAIVTKLSESGLFKGVSYRFATSGGGLAVTFAVEEQAWDTPVIYDNFVGIPDEELSKAILAEVPTYDGTAPANGLVPLISHALAGLLRARGQAGTIDYKPLANLDGTNRRSVFTVQPAPPLCGLHVDGSAQVPEAEVVAVAKSAIGAAYSRHQFEALARTSFAEPYHEHGLWKAAFAPHVATLGASGACQGVLATVHVEEGQPYKWDHIEWTGSAAIAEKDLTALVPLKPGDLADSRKLAAGLQAVEHAQHKLGYITAKSAVAPELDDQAQRIVFKVAIVEGPLFHMGTVTFVGVPPTEGSGLIKQWKLKPGDPYDDSYPGEFRATALRTYTPPHAFALTATADPTTHVVDLLFTRK